VSESRLFRRAFDALPEIFGFTEAFFARQGVDREILTAVDFVVEELFTNMVKYGAAADPGSEVRIEIEAVEGGVEVVLADSGVEPFDVTGVPDADTGAPIEERRPGGLGLHLIRRLVDSWDYEYVVERRESRIRFKKTLAGKAAQGGTSTGEM
jgi:anti-sigma regulatory factor (Ser/Thr protein kinase)